MALPFPVIPVLVGAAIGAAVTYFLANRNARNQITNALQDLGNTVEAAMAKVKNVASDAVEDATDAAKKAASKVTD